MSDVGGFIADMARRQRKGETFETPGFGLSGWISDSDPWVIVDATKFRIIGKDVRYRYSIGCKLRLVDTGTKYAYVVATAMSGSDTLVTIAGDALSGAAITGPSYSYAANPQGFTHWFAWVPETVGFSINPTAYHRFSINGRTVSFNATYTATGTSNSTAYTISLPIAAAASINLVIPTITDGGVNKAAGVAQISGSTATLYLSAFGAWTATGGKGASFAGFYEI